jgi:hypothetical protein
MRRNKGVLLVYSFLLILFSCKEQTTVETEVYSDGSRKEIRVHRDTPEKKNIVIFYPNGAIKRKWSIVNDAPNGNFESYDSLGEVDSRGFFYNGQAVGPIYYYYNGHLVLYNERDLSNGIYYVKKYDSITHKLVKEEGICLSPKVEKKESGDRKSIIFFYAQPDGYSNSIQVFLNGIKTSFSSLDGHIGNVETNSLSSGEHVKICSTLRSNNAEVICADSIIYEVK